jgi:hypothetical protein
MVFVLTFARGAVSIFSEVGALFFLLHLLLPPPHKPVLMG